MLFGRRLRCYYVRHHRRDRDNQGPCGNLSRYYARRHGFAIVGDGAVVRHCRGPAGDGLCECARKLFISYVFKQVKPQSEDD